MVSSSPLILLQPKKIFTASDLRPSKCAITQEAIRALCNICDISEELKKSKRSRKKKRTRRWNSGRGTRQRIRRRRR